MHSGGNTTGTGPAHSWAWRLLLALCLLACDAWAGDVVRLRGGREVEGRILAITAEVITLQVEQGVLRLPREQVLSIHMEQTQVVVPAPPAASGAGGTAAEGGAPAASPEERRDPEPGEEGWKAPEPQPVPAQPVPGAAPAARKPGPSLPLDAPAGHAGTAAGREADDPVHSLLSRYLWLVPENPTHRISLGAGLLFLATLIVFLAGKLADVEGATFTRSFFLAGSLIGLALLQAALFSRSGWPILAALCTADLLFWYTMARFFLGATLWKGTVMLASSFFAALLGVLWLEVMGYVLNL